MRRDSTAARMSLPVPTRDARGEAQVTPRDLSTYLARAMTRLGVQVKEVALTWGTDHGYVSRILANKDPLPDHRLAQLDAALRRATLEEWAADEGMVVGRKADIGRALESLARLAVEDDRLPQRAERMAKMEPER